MSRQACGREYLLIEYDGTQAPWKQLRRMPMLKISASGVVWLNDRE